MKAANPRDVEAAGMSASGKPARAPRSRVRAFLWGTAAVVIAVGAAYAGGRLETRARIDELEQRLLDAQQSLEAARAEQAAERRRINELEARRRIHLALLAFEQNNFGTAQGHLRSAGALLGAGDPALSELGAALGQLELSPTLDLAAQREAIVQLATKFDSLRPPPEPGR